ncbi:MAG: hypothetical protein HQL90_11800 [Magnetococcales bacterium]|nr:hypothetical protein [Magnetococcales bacterium]
MMATEQNAFAERLTGRFDGMIRQEDARRLAETVALLDGWYLLEPQGSQPDQPVDGQTARHHLEGLLQEILREERGVWSTMVYVQSQEDPWIIKVFHPRRAGCGCGGQGGILPWWVLSRLKPEAVAEWDTAACAVPAAPKKSSWLKLFR